MAKKRAPLSELHRERIALANSCKLKTQRQLETSRATMARLWSTQRARMIDAQRKGWAKRRARIEDQADFTYQDFLSMPER